MPAHDAARGEHIDGEKGGAQHRALGDTAGDTVGVRFALPRATCSGLSVR